VKAVALFERGPQPDNHGTPKPDPEPKPAATPPEGYVRIEPGSFTMGSPASEVGRQVDETEHRVTITRPFWLKAMEVTLAEWEAVMGADPEVGGLCGRDADCPVSTISWTDAVRFVNSLSRESGLEQCYTAAGFKGLACKGYRLPTEAEWEYAARAGTTDPKAGHSLRDGEDGALEEWRSRRNAPNGWGLHNMMRLPSEWVHDWMGPYLGDSVDPVGPSAGTHRIVRGAGYCPRWHPRRVAKRCALEPDPGGEVLAFIAVFGLRPARTIP
jgi:sulfatase modifying factor 1